MSPAWRKLCALVTASLLATSCAGTWQLPPVREPSGPFSDYAPGATADNFRIARDGRTAIRIQVVGEQLWVRAAPWRRDPERPEYDGRAANEVPPLCLTPCTLYLPPGRIVLGFAAQQHALPRWTRRIRVGFKAERLVFLRSTGTRNRIGTGIAATGGVMVVLGLVVAGTVNPPNGPVNDEEPERTITTVGLSTVLAGIVPIVIGGVISLGGPSEFELIACLPIDSTGTGSLAASECERGSKP